jgi:RIO kinase 2
VFDWPQAVPTDHENAEELLRRDVDNLIGYFRRKYPNRTPEVDEGALAAALRDGAFETVREFA